jgi:lysozyme family protein
MRGNFETCFMEMMRHESPEVIDGRSYGVSLELYADALGAFPEEVDLRRLNSGVAQTIHRQRHWHPLACDQLPTGVDLVLFDAAVCVGVTHAAIWLQSILRDRQDGDIDRRTLTAVNAFVARYGVETLINTYRKQRDFQNERSPEFAKLGAKMKARSAAVAERALRMLA